MMTLEIEEDLLGCATAFPAEGLPDCSPAILVRVSAVLSALIDEIPAVLFLRSPARQKAPRPASENSGEVASALFEPEFHRERGALGDGAAFAEGGLEALAPAPDRLERGLVEDPLGFGRHDPRRADRTRRTDLDLEPHPALDPLRAGSRRILRQHLGEYDQPSGAISVIGLGTGGGTGFDSSVLGMMRMKSSGCGLGADISSVSPRRIKASINNGKGRLMT